MEKQLTIIVKRCNEKGLISFKVSDQKIEKIIKTMLIKHYSWFIYYNNGEGRKHNKKNLIAFY